jgi:cell division protease FtsH
MPWMTGQTEWIQYRAPARKADLEERGCCGGFLGDGDHHYRVASLPGYYKELLAWGVCHHIQDDGWQVARTLGFRKRDPVFAAVSTGLEESETLLMDGQLLVQKEEHRLIITIDASYRSSFLVEGPQSDDDHIVAFMLGVQTLLDERNFYRGAKVEFAKRLRFLDVKSVGWDSIVMDEEIKQEIRSSSVGFLEKAELWDRLGIPPSRGILLAGEPGTGKTMVCRALMAEATGMTCITTSAHAFSDDLYVSELYDLARDLAPSLVFLEDLDVIGQDRDYSHYMRAPSLMSLLSAMDGIERKSHIVTIATTNSLAILDKALAHRPGRFDRIVRLGRPDLTQRMELVRRVCGRIPLDEAERDYIARRSEGCTPAQIQEIIFGLAIMHSDEFSGGTAARVGTTEIDHALSGIAGRERSPLGLLGHQPT